MTIQPPLTDREAIALTLEGEARNQGVNGRIAVASVLRNRLKDGRWGSTYASVCLAPKQFSCWNDDDKNLPYLMDLIERYRAGGPTTANPIWRECLWIADGLMTESVTSSVGDATHYYANSLTVRPKWAFTGHFVTSVGAHLFFDRVA